MAAKKEQIREAAVSVIAEVGYHTATTDKIAAEAGVAIGTIYNYFRSKEEILEYIYLVELEKRRKFFKNLGTSDLDVLGKLRSLLQMHFAEVKNNPTVGQILVRERHLADKGPENAIREFVQGVPLAIQSLLDQAVETGEIRKCDTKIVSHALFGAVEAVVRTAVFSEEGQERDEILDGAAGELVALVADGIKAK